MGSNREEKYIMKIINQKLVVETKIKDNKFYYDCTIYKNTDGKEDKIITYSAKDQTSEELEEKICMLFTTENTMTILENYLCNICKEK